jgi:large subunit ribosomal protein L3
VPPAPFLVLERVKMINTIIGKKLSQTQKFTEGGVRTPITVVEAGPCTVVWIKDQKMQIAWGEVKKGNKSVVGHVKKAGLTKAPLFLAEVALVDNSQAYKPGDKVQLSEVLAVGDVLDVVGVSRGKGFMGVVKRWGFKGGPRTHGQSDRERAPGSIGQTTTPGRVYKGKKMAGRTGGDQVTIKNLKVFAVDAEKNLVYVTGLVPGVADSLLTLTRVGVSHISASSPVEPEIAVQEEVMIPEEEKTETSEENVENTEVIAEETK